jgi:hypothetical protein
MTVQKILALLLISVGPLAGCTSDSQGIHGPLVNITFRQKVDTPPDAPLANPSPVVTAMKHFVLCDAQAAKLKTPFSFGDFTVRHVEVSKTRHALRIDYYLNPEADFSVVQSKFLAATGVDVMAIQHKQPSPWIEFESDEEDNGTVSCIFHK